MQINWYPGHMAKARRMLEESIKKVDIVIQLADARIPASSINPDIADMSAGKKSIIILNKSDLADRDGTS
ncbi:MAG TPA: ribosome biogenesis GTPase YlqF, partial [Clostridia bacterium]|nr:ribosome biogenesis GTPase YlqF [Clostridia bacterium]